MSHNFLRSNTTAYSVAIWKVTINFLLKFPVNSGDGGGSELYGTNRQVVKFKMRLIKAMETVSTSRNYFLIIFFPAQKFKKVYEKKVNSKIPFNKAIISLTYPVNLSSSVELNVCMIAVQ